MYSWNIILTALRFLRMPLKFADEHVFDGKYISTRRVFPEGSGAGSWLIIIIANRAAAAINTKIAVKQNSCGKLRHSQVVLVGPNIARRCARLAQSYPLVWRHKCVTSRTRHVSFVRAAGRGNASMWLHRQPSRQPTLPPALDGLI